MKRIISIICLALMGWGAWSQEAAWKPVPVSLPIDTKNLSFVDDVFYCNSANVLLKASYRNDKVINLDAAMEVLNINSKIDYVVRHPQSGELYFTVPNSKGVSLLYVYDTTGKKPTAKQVKMEGDKFSVIHPVFSKDGKLMVFSSPDGIGFGGMDLWYSRRMESGWSAPTNLGHKVNGSGQETSPCIYDDYLIFATDSRSVDEESFASHTQLYATRLIATAQEGDTVMMLPVGQAPIQMLPSPFNNHYESMEMAADYGTGSILWTSVNGGKLTLYEMKGTMVGALLTGCVRDDGDKPVAGVKIRVIDDRTALLVGTLVTDANGRFNIFVDSDKRYEVAMERSGYFGSIRYLSTERGQQSPDLMFTEHRVDVHLEQMVQGRPYALEDVFGPNADVDLAGSGEEQLQRMAMYMCDNPDVVATVEVKSDPSMNVQFNRLVTEYRLQALKDYFESHGVASGRVKVVNGNAKSADAEGSGACAASVVLN